MARCPACSEVNPEGNRFCGACGAELTAAGPEVRKVVTAVFCDLVGSTALGEEYDPEVLRPVLHRFFEEMRAALERHGGRVEKYIGDAVAAVFGVPRSHEDDALRAVRAAVEMQARIEVLNREATIPIACRIGVETGEVLVPGGDEPLVGDAMNTAARLQTAAAPGEVLVGASTFDLVLDAVVAEPVPPLELKGKAEPVRAYRILEVHASAVEGRARHLESPLVGREREGRQLADALDEAVRDASVHLFTLVGHPGIGKTRLVEEFMATAGAGARVVRGRCLPYGDGITFWPVAEIVREAAGVAEDDAVGLAREKIAALLPEGPDRASIVERVTELLGLGATPNPDETFWAVRRLLEALAADHPLVCVIEDLHWAEPRLLDLIDHVTDWSRGVPILLLCDARPEFLEQRTNWAGGKLNATTTLLHPLSTDEVEELIGNLLGGAGLDDDVVARVTEAAEGNPLFVEQLLAMLVDRGALRSEDGRWVAAGEVTLVVVPPSIQALLGARLDGLEPTERRLLEAAAIEGRTFHVGTAATLTGLSRGEATTLLLGLTRKELLRPDQAALAGEEAFRFRHVLIADAAYEAISKRTRADLHERFAVDFEARLGERVPEYREILGYHLERALRLREELGEADDTGLAARASEHLVAAGRRALARGDAAAAALLLKRGMALLPPGRDRFSLLPDLALALTEGAQWVEAIRLLDEAVGATPESDTGPLWHRLRVEQVLAQLDAGGQQPAQREGLAVAEAARIVAEAAADDLLLSRALVCRAQVLAACPPVDLIAAKEAVEAACEAGIRSGDLRAIGDAENWLGGIYCWGPFTIDEAVALCDELLEGNGDRLLWAYGTANGYARAHAFRGEFDEARVLLARAADSFAELGATRGWYGTAAIRADVEALAGDPNAAAEVLREVVERGERSEPEALASIAADLAFHHAAAGEVDEAEGWLSRAGPASGPEGEIFRAGVRLRILVARGRLHQALADARRLTTEAGITDWLDIRAAFLECATDVFAAAGTDDELRSTLEALADAHRRRGNLVGLRRTEGRIARLAPST